MGKEVDINGFWLIKGNPVTKEGVFPYLGSQIDFSGSLGLEPNKIYNVYRPASELEKPDTIESFNGDPFIDNHEMLGDGCTNYDDRPAGGSMFNVRKGDTPGMIVADFKIYSESLKENIESGKKELSLGYRCKYEPQRGVFEGKTYDFKQTCIAGNHIALVDKGRMGSDVRVYDSKATVFDSIEEINAIQKGEDTMTDKEKSAAKRKAIGEALDGVCSEEEIQAVQDMCDPEVEKTEDETEEKAEVETAEDAEKDEEAKTEDENEDDEAKTEDEEEEKPASAEDTFAAIAPIIAARDALVEQVTPFVGAFDSAVMTAKDVAVYACKKLELQCTEDEALPLLKGYLMNADSKPAQFALDSAVVPGKDTSLENYLEGK